MSTNSLFDTQEGRDELAKASLVFMQAALEALETIDPDKFLAVGGVLRLPDRQYAQTFLEMVNYNLHLSEMNLTAMVTSGARASTTRLPREELDQIVKTLGEIQASPRKAAVRHGKHWRQESFGRVFKIADFSRNGSGLREEDCKVILGGYAAFAYVQQLLSTAPLSNQLRRCELSSCGRFFLYEQAGRGAPPRYCVGTDHARQALKIQTRKRVSDYRLQLKKKRRKSK